MPIKGKTVLRIWQAGRPTGHGRAEKQPCGCGNIGAMAGLRPCTNRSTQKPKEDKMTAKITAANAKAIRQKKAAEAPLILHKKKDYHHRWTGWDPNIGAMVEQEIIIEMWDRCTAAPTAGGKVEVTTADRRLEHQLAELHRARPQECSAGRKTMNITTYTMEAETWQTWLAEHTEAEKNDES